MDLMRQTVPWAAAQWVPTGIAVPTTSQSVLPPLLTALDQTLLFVTSCTILCEFCSITSQNTILILKPILIISLKFLSPVITCVHLTVGDFISSNYLNNRARGENQYFCRLSSFGNNLRNCPKKADSGLGPNQTRPDNKMLSS